MRLPHPLYGLYERRLAAALPPDRLPRHVGVIIDGNRRWARQAGKPLQGGYKRGAAKYHEVVEWCDQVGVEVVTLWLLSTDNLHRPKDQIEPLLRIIEDVVRDLAASERWRVHPVGAPDLLPPETARVALIGNYRDDGFAPQFLRSLQSVAASFAVEPIAADVRDAVQVERVMESMIRYQLKGEIRCDWHAEGFVCEIAIPA